MTYQYKVEKPTRRVLPLNRLKNESLDEKFTGMVEGESASDLEERYARGLYKRKLEFDFQYYADVVTTIPGQAKQIDFIVFSGMPYPVELDGEWVHKSAEQRQEDEDRDALVNEALAPYGYMPIKRLHEEDVSTPERVEYTIREQFG